MNHVLQLALSLLGALGGGYALVRLASRLLSPVADKGIDAGEHLAESHLDGVAYFKAHPDELATVKATLRFVAGRLKLATEAALADLGASSSFKDALAKIVSDEKAIAVGVLRVDTLSGILTAAGLMPPGASVLDWLESEMGHIVAAHLNSPGVAGSVAEHAGPISQNGHASFRVALVLALLAACSAAQKAAEKQDAKAFAAQVVDCTRAEVQAALPQVVAKVLPVLTGASLDTAGLEAVAAADGLSITICAVEQVVADVEHGFQRPMDGGLSLVQVDAAKVGAALKGIHFLHAHPHTHP